MTEWNKASQRVFWGEIAPCDHVVQIYDNDVAFLDLLHDFVHDGLSQKENVIVLATPAHLESLNTRLETSGFSISHIIAEQQYVPLDANEILDRFMVNDWPDENLFNAAILELLKKSGARNRKVRAFGEMVALLWENGQAGATVRLEHLWNKLCAHQHLSLFCAYPQSGFTQNANESLRHICSAHSRIIHHAGQGEREILYKDSVTTPTDA